MTAAAGLRAVRELLAAPERWTQHSAARDATGVPVAFYAPTAACWCLIGAIGRMRAWDEMTYVREAAKPVTNLPRWQDRASHPEVLALLDRAIALAEGDEG